MILAIIISFIVGAMFGVLVISLLVSCHDRYEDIKYHEDTRKRNQ